MSIDVDIYVFEKKQDEIFKVVEKLGLGIKDGEICIAGFCFSVYGYSFTEEDIKQFKEEGSYEPWMERKSVHLNNCTYMGCSMYGDSRLLQFPIAHTLAQSLAMQLNTEVMIDNPQNGEKTFYRRTDHPEVHAVLEDKVPSMSFECPNFCEQKDGDGEWVECGFKTKDERKHVLGM
jgi:hypothetical protein